LEFFFSFSGISTVVWVSVNHFIPVYSVRKFCRIIVCSKQIRVTTP
jgi:hypothetical protein